MSSLISIMTSAMSNAQIGMRTAANNVSNAATEGYTRQRVNMGTQPSIRAGINIWLGSGATVEAIQRMQSNLLTQQVNTTKSVSQKSQTYVDNFGQLNALMSNLEDSMATTLGEFTTSASALATDPSVSSVRDRFMSAASTVAARFQEASVHMDSITADLNQQVEQAANDINTYAKQIAAINKNANSDANDLQDERDRLIAKISEKVSVTVVRNGQGSVDVFLPNGQPLVVRDKTFALTTYRNDDDPTAIEIGFAGPTGPQPLGTGALTGGSLAGITAFRQEGLKMAQNELGRMAMAFADAANAVHRLGQTPTGAQGGDLFAYSQPAVHSYLANGGTAQLSSTVTDSTKLTAASYQIAYDGAQWSVTRSTDGTTVTSATMPVTVDGFELSIASGAASAGDRFVVDPARPGAGSIRFLLNASSQIASGYPVHADDVNSNSGYGKVARIEPMTAPWNAAIKTPVDVVYTGPGTFTVGGVAPDSITATPEGWEVEANGWKLTISGTPNVGDTFRVRPVSGSGDGRNGAALADLSKARIIGEESTVTGAYSRLVNAIGSRTAIAETALKTSESMAEQAIARRDSVSGVNLDEEAAELMRWQQMYQAALKVTQTADEMLDSLFAALG